MAVKLKTRQFNTRPQTRSHAATQSSEKQKHYGPRSRKVKKAMIVEAKAHKLRTKHRSAGSSSCTLRHMCLSCTPSGNSAAYGPWK